MARQIRTLNPGETVNLVLHSVGARDPWIVEATVIGREGEGDNEKVIFTDAGDPRGIRWNVFRFKNRWAWGPSMAPVSVFDENAAPRKKRTPKIEVTPLVEAKPIVQTNPEPEAKKPTRTRRPTKKVNEPVPV